MEPRGELVFVYGSLRRGEANHARLLATGARFEALARFPGRLYDLGAYPGAVPSCEAGEEVIGELYRLPDPARGLGELDELEECDPARPENGLFLRRLTQVVREGGSPAAAWIYLLPREPERMPRLPAGDWRGRASGAR